MKTKEEIVANWLPRYTKRSLNDFGEYILLTNFNKYVELFADKFNVPVLGRDANMTSAHAEGITIINFGMGSPNAAIIMDLLGAIQPKACLFLGKCGGIDRKNKLGDLILPIAAIRGEGTSNDYYPPEVPALPAFMLQRSRFHIHTHGTRFKEILFKLFIMLPYTAVGSIYRSSPIIAGMVANSRRNGTLQHKCR